MKYIFSLSRDALARNKTKIINERTVRSHSADDLVWHTYVPSALVATSKNPQEDAQNKNLFLPTCAYVCNTYLLLDITTEYNSNGVI